jgi:murein DD-endopeptidase MepM/ murein hydrolase activator NlpD
MLFFGLMPLKLTMMIQNITDMASTVPTYATEQRLEYLTTRMMAVHLLHAANSNIDEKLVFCKGGGIACSLTKTWTTDYFEKKYDITFNAEPGGRSSLGGIARKWNISVAGVDNPANPDLEGPIRQIQKNSDMKKLIKKSINEQMKTKNILMRYLGRKILMKKFGVSTWRGPDKVEQASNKLATIKANMRSSIIKNTIGKISPRMGAYLGCLSGEDTTTCQNLRDHFASQVQEIPNPDDDPHVDKNSPQYQAQKAQYTANEKLKAAGGLTVTGDESSSVLKKLLSKRVLAVAGGGTAAIGILDMAFKAVGSINNGALSEIWYDMSTQTYAGYSTEIITANQKIQAGDLDLETVSVLTDYFNEAEKSPLFQSENGYLTTPGNTASAAAGAVTRTCGSGEDAKPTTLQPGQVLCPESQAVRDYTKDFSSNPFWQSIVKIADAWNASIGQVVKLVGDTMSAILDPIITNIPGLKELMAAAGTAIQPLIEWFMGMIFDPPTPAVDGEANRGITNYEMLSGGIRTTQNALMETGVDDNGKALGGGGKLLTDGQVVAINSAVQADNADYFNSQSKMAQIFDVNLTGSFMQAFVAKMPMSLSSAAALPSTVISSTFNGSSASAQTATTSNPFKLPMYGYGIDDPTLSKDPGDYTDDSCTKSAEIRANSKQRRFEETGYPIATYSESDPCALEKMVTGIALADAGITDDQWSFSDITEGGDTGAAGGTTTANSGNINPNGWTFPTTAGATLTSPFGPRGGGYHTGVDLNVPSGSPFYATRDGVVKLHQYNVYTINGDGGAWCPVLSQMSDPNQKDIWITHNVDGQVYTSIYAHMSAYLKKEGDQVKAGDLIGYTGGSGCSSGPHVHFEIWKGKATPGIPGPGMTDPWPLINK